MLARYSDVHGRCQQLLQRAQRQREQPLSKVCVNGALVWELVASAVWVALADRGTAGVSVVVFVFSKNCASFPGPMGPGPGNCAAWGVVAVGGGGTEGANGG